MIVCLYGKDDRLLSWPPRGDGKQKVDGINRQLLFTFPPLGVRKQVSAPLNQQVKNFEESSKATGQIT